MGQRLYYPPNVAGWPGGLTWLGGPALLARGRFAATFADQAFPGGPRHWAEVARRHGKTSPEDRRALFATLLLGAPLQQPDRVATDDRLVQELLGSPEGNVC